MSTVADQNVFDAEQQKAFRQVQAMLDKAASTTFPAERDTFLAKAQEIMTRLGITTATLERESGKTTGKREEQKVKGGFYAYQRRLWSAVAELNFCMYWTQKYREERTGASYIAKWGAYATRHRHKLIGRTVNVQATIALTTYLQQAIERAVREYVHGDMTQHLSANANAFREGMADVLVAKVGERFKRRLAEERERQYGPDRPTSGFGREVALTDVIEQEEAGNYDFIHGEGAYARKLAEEAKWAREQAKREAAYTAWAAANPEEAARKAKEQEEAMERYWRSRRGGRRSSGGNTKWIDPHSYHAGRDAAKAVGLDPQTESSSAKVAGRLTHG